MKSYSLDLRQKIVDSYENGDTFVWLIEKILVPKLWSGAVVVMANLPAHMRRGLP
jgi:hypothetical protein